jgi:hypothetical protein
VGKVDNARVHFRTLNRSGPWGLNSHTNPVISGKRWYNYVIFDTKEILGVDLKFIVRKEHAPTKE